MADEFAHGDQNKTKKDQIKHFKGSQRKNTSTPVTELKNDIDLLCTVESFLPLLKLFVSLNLPFLKNLAVSACIDVSK